MRVSADCSRKHICRSRAFIRPPRGRRCKNTTPGCLPCRGADGERSLRSCTRGGIGRRRRRPRAYLDIFGRDRFFLELQHLLLPDEVRVTADLVELGKHLQVGIVATNNVHYLHPDRFRLHDVLTCVRTLTTLEEVHPERPLNAQAYLRSPAEMEAYFADCPEALKNAEAIAERCEPALQPGGYRFPEYPTAPGETAAGTLARLALRGAKQRYQPLSETVVTRLRHELSVIRELRFDNYFLAVWDVLQFARRQQIRYAGRGSAADSLVAYCLGITKVDPVARGLLFERFMSLERAAPPDIDVDFQAERRDEVTQYLTDRYGPEHVATVATYNTFQARSAVRDLGKAIGLAPADIDHLATRLPYLRADAIESALVRVPELRDGHLATERYHLLLELCREAAGYPRHLSTHLGGVIVTGDPITNISPLQLAAKGVSVIQFDKDDVEDLGLVKLDLLCLRMLSAVDQSVRSIQTRDRRFDYDSIPHDDRPTYDLISSTETVGMFQLESPAQRSLHARLQPDRYEDLVAAVALIRPGPVQANMVTPYLERRAGREPITYLHPALERILAKTYGVVLFQEQVIEIATTVAGFTPGEADKLRRTMTHHRSWEEMERIGEHFLEKAMSSGVTEEVAREVFSYIRAYAGYGFCEAHSAAFADTAYKSAYLLAHHPADFYAALLSSQPMGFYPSNTLVWEAKRRGIGFLPPDVNASEARFTVEGEAIRVGLVQIHGLGEESRRAVLEGAGGGAVSFRGRPGATQWCQPRRLAQSHFVRRVRFPAHASAAGVMGVRGAVGLGADAAAERGGGAGGAGGFFRAGKMGAGVFALGDRADAASGGAAAGAFAPRGGHDDSNRETEPDRTKSASRRPGDSPAPAADEERKDSGLLHPGGRDRAAGCNDVRAGISALRRGRVHAARGDVGREAGSQRQPDGAGGVGGGGGVAACGGERVESRELRVERPARGFAVSTIRGWCGRREGNRHRSAASGIHAIW